VYLVVFSSTVEKLDDDYLYNWYRALYELFYKQGFRLYHTSSHDSLCLQVTMMESCMYYLSFIRNPGSHVFVLHPPADYGKQEENNLNSSRIFISIFVIIIRNEVSAFCWISRAESNVFGNGEIACYHYYTDNCDAG